jgi:hypothetical protein
MTRSAKRFCQGAPRRDKDLVHFQAFQPPYEHVPVDGIPIAEQVLGRGLFPSRSFESLSISGSWPRS